MTSKDFNTMLDNRLADIKKVMASKGAEYAAESDDRLHNFKVAARMNDTTAAKALWGMMTKHLVSVTDMIAKDEASDYLINEKIGDCINYFILLEAIFRDKLEEQK